MDDISRSNPGVAVECTSQADHILVTAEGTWTDTIFRQIVDTARAAATEHGLSRILLDMRALSRPDSNFTRYLAGLYVADTMGGAARIAAIGAPGNVTHYGETVARNRGTDFMAFVDEEQARQWLLR